MVRVLPENQDYCVNFRYHMLGDDIGSLEEGKVADLVAFRVDGIEHAGAGSDRVAALMTCAPVAAWLSVINGKVVIENSKPLGVDIDALVQQHSQQSQNLLDRAAAKG